MLKFILTGVSRTFKVYSYSLFFINRPSLLVKKIIFIHEVIQQFLPLIVSLLLLFSSFFVIEVFTKRYRIMILQVHFSFEAVVFSVQDVLASRF
jgi:hypothetical protein